MSRAPRQAVAYAFGAVELLVGGGVFLLGLAAMQKVSFATRTEDTVIAWAFAATGAAALVAATTLLFHRTARWPLLLGARVVALATEIVFAPLTVKMLRLAQAHAGRGWVDLTDASVRFVEVLAAFLVALSAGALVYTWRRFRRPS